MEGQLYYSPTDTFSMCCSEIQQMAFFQLVAFYRRWSAVQQLRISKFDIFWAGTLNALSAINFLFFNQLAFFRNQAAVFEK